MTGIFLSSSGLKTESCSHRLKSFSTAPPAESQRAGITRALPLKRWGTNDDIARSALFLASGASSYVTGTILDTDGGVCVLSPESGRVDAVFDWQNDPRVKGRRS